MNNIEELYHQYLIYLRQSIQTPEKTHTCEGGMVVSVYELHMNILEKIVELWKAEQKND